ncbi:HD-GYP domain-containing protein [Nitriliruptor alkaliphilus]|uniref:HD-GYP domain-containing protein n=1 Tax=Nitriliruptor alkaliphilus TaxID=427918 RepID=UPI0012ECC212|nr:HD-GYP domain-containing protein [Nitriliruptor alkaliphilus]
MQRRSRLTLVVVVVAAMGSACLGVAIPRAPLWVGIAYLVAFFVTELLSTKLRDDVRVSLSNLVVLVAILADGPAVAVIASLGGPAAIAFKVSDQRLLRVAFNAGQFAVAAAVAGGTYTGLIRLFGADFPDPGAVLAIAIASVVYVSVNYLFVGMVVAAASGEPLSSAWRSVVQVGWLQAPYVGIAILAAALLRAGGIGPVLLLLLALPVFVARSGLVAFQKTDEAYDRLVRSFVTAIEVKDLYTRGHSERVAELSVHVAEELGVPYDERRLTGYAALLHDVGKIGVPLCVINKPGPLDDDEFEQIKQHPTIGARILRDIDFLAPVLDIVRFHHERLDGRGYPHGVSEEELGDLVRIVTTVDAFDAMTSTRSYRRALGVDEAVAELRRCVGHQFDSRMVEALAAVVVRLDWQPTVEFASAAELKGREIPLGTAADRFNVDAGGGS